MIYHVALFSKDYYLLVSFRYARQTQEFLYNFMRLSSWNCPTLQYFWCVLAPWNLLSQSFGQKVGSWILYSFARFLPVWVQMELRCRKQRKKKINKDSVQDLKAITLLNRKKDSSSAVWCLPADADFTSQPWYDSLGTRLGEMKARKSPHRICFTLFVSENTPFPLIRTEMDTLVFFLSLFSVHF